MSSLLSDITLPEQLTLGYAIGRAAGEALAPFVQDLANAAWSANATRPIAAEEAAAVAAEDVAQYGAMETEASLTGIHAGRFANLCGVTLEAPGTGELLRMLRRSDEQPIDFAHGLRKARLEQQWDAALQNLRWERISAPDLAYMVVRGIVPDAGTLGSTLPTSAPDLTLPQQHSLDTLAEAARTGWDSDRFAMLVQRSGLAMAPGMAAQARFRGILSQAAYELTIARGDLYPAFADPVLQVSRQIPTAGEAVQYQLRGFTDRAGRLSLTALHGMSDAHSDVIYDIAGRAPAVHAITTGLARGASYPSDYSVVPEPYRAAIQRSDIRPEFADIVYHDRYTYPSGFQIRAETQNGTLSQTESEQILLEVGWQPKWATFFSTAWAGSTTTAADKHVAKAQTTLYTTTHKSYVANEISAATATTALQAAGVPAASIPGVLAVWNEERSLIRKSLSAAQIKKAYTTQTTNPATGAAWTLQDATARLLELGYDQADATVLLEE